MLLLFLFFSFHWCYSPSWSLASSTDVFQWSRFFIYRLQVPSIIFRSAYTESSFTIVGLPTRIVPSGLDHVEFLEGYWSCILQRYSRQLNFPSLIFTVHVALNIYFLKLISDPLSLYFILLNWFKDISQCSSFSFLSTLSSLLMSAPHPLS